MDIIQIIVLALVQGVTEFLPISSSAHLILVPYFLQLKDQGLLFDVALHGGTLLAILVYLKDDVKDILSGIIDKTNEKGRTLLMFLIVGTIPVGLCGLIFHDYISLSLRTPQVIAISSIVWGIALFYGDRKHGGKTIDSLTMADVIKIALFQAIALIPGTSRSGITIMAGLLIGLNRVESARFSFLLSIPVITLATGLEIYKYLTDSSPTMAMQQVLQPVSAFEIFLGFSIALVSSYLTVKFFIAMLNRLSFTPFVVYRVLLGAVILLFAL